MIVNKLKLLSLSLLSACTLLPLFPSMTKVARATCVAVDVNNQVALRGTQTPSHQENNVGMVATPDCAGNVSTSVGNSVAASSGEINQIRNSQHILSGGADSSAGVTGPTIFVPVNNQVDVYVPAYDPQFMQSVGASPLPTQ